MRNNSIYVWIVVIVLIIVGFFVWRWYSNNNQNTWVCNNGEWSAVGSPNTPTPSSSCATNLQQSTSTPSTASSTVSLVLQPKQCTTEPWQSWYKEGKIQFIQAPTDEQLMKAYYANVYGINIFSAKRNELGDVTCQTCNKCSKNYVFTIEVDSKDVAKLESLGWANVGQKQ